MRATCEQCHAVQPATWAAGDLCTACGRSVRHEVRCFWCTGWTPAAAFCRTCGADVVDERNYGAARMLKDAGTDRFSVPAQLSALGEDRIENFRRIYQRHAAVAARHVDELHAVERHLHDRSWSARLDDELAAQLPWSADDLRRYEEPAGIGPTGGGEAADEARQVHDTTPCAVTRQIAALALVHLGDLSAFDEVRTMLRTADDPALRAEAALVLSTWRVRTAHDLSEDRDAIIAELTGSRFAHAAAVRLAALRGDVDALPPADVLAGDPDSLFDAALQRGDVDMLSAALAGDELACVAAARSLVAHGVVAPLERPLRDAPDAVRAEILDALQRSELPCDELHGALVDLAAFAHDGHLRRKATRVACRSMTHESALRIARGAAAVDAWDASAIRQSLLQCERLGRDTVVALADLMVEQGTFTMQQFGLATVAEDGRLPDTYVPSRFDRADDGTRRELLAVAERQLGSRADADLHRFALRVLFGSHPSATRVAAMWVLRRWYRQQGDIRGEGPFVLQVAAVEDVFGGLDTFVTGLCAVLRDEATMGEVGVYEYLAHLLGTADDRFIDALQRERAGVRLDGALTAALERDHWPATQQAMRTLLARLRSRDGDGAVAQRRSTTTLPTE